MSHLLPPQGHPAREMFAVEDLVAAANGDYPVPCQNWQLRKSAAATFAGNSAAKRVVFIKVNPTNDQVELVSIGRRGGVRREWVFGPMTKAMRLA